MRNSQQKLIGEALVGATAMRLLNGEFMYTEVQLLASGTGGAKAATAFGARWCKSYCAVCC